MNKIKILFHLNQLSYGGTEKAILTFIENLDRSRFEPHLFVHSYRGSFRHYRHLLFSFFSAKAKRTLQQKTVTQFSAIPQFEAALGGDKIYFGQWAELKEAVKKINPQILHLNRGSQSDFFTDKLHELPKDLKIVETNIFAKRCNENYWSRIDQSFFVSHYCLDKSPWHGGKGRVLYNPIKARISNDSLREKYNIPASAIVLGQIGRPDLVQDDWVYQAYQRNKRENVYLCVLGCTQKINELKKSDDKIVLIEATTDGQVIDQFFNTIDILLHRRFDGETFGMNIAEAMIYGKPVVSHRSSVDNAQAELLDAKEFGPVGYVTEEKDRESYFSHVQDLIANVQERQALGQNASKKALNLYEASVVTKKLQDYYMAALASGDKPAARVEVR